MALDQQQTMKCLVDYFADRTGRTHPTGLPEHDSDKYDWQDFNGIKVVWIDAPVTQAELDAVEADFIALTVKQEDRSKWTDVRPIRNRLLEITDWMEDSSKNGRLTAQQRTDAVTDRASLRAITGQADHKNVVWPKRFENQMESDILIAMFRQESL